MLKNKLNLDFFISELKTILLENNVNYKLKRNNLNEWKRFYNKTNYVPVIYQHSYIDYQETYFKDVYDLFEDLSLIIYEDNLLCIWPISIGYKDNKFIVNTFGENIMPPLFVKNTSANKKKLIYKKIYKITETFIRKLKIINPKYVEPYIHNNGISKWFSICSDKAKSIDSKFLSFLNLNEDIVEIKKNFRKSFKSLLNIKNDKLKLYKLKIDINKWNEIKDLHFQVAGRKTRSDDTWINQFEALKNNEAFSIYIENEKNEIIGASYFNCSRDECYYSMGAYNKKYLKDNISHIIQYNAIKEMKNRNIKWYKIGVLDLKLANHNYEKKNQTISLFKSGFSSHIFCEHIITK